MHKLQINKLVLAFFAQFKVLLGKPQYKTLSTLSTSGKTNLFVVQVPYFAPLPNTSLNDAKVAQLGSAITQLVNTLPLTNTSQCWEHGNKS